MNDTTHSPQWRRAAPSRPTSSRADDGQAIALLDVRYLRWLASADAKASTVGVRERMPGLLHHLLSRSGLNVQLLRVYWYSDEDDHAVFDDQTLRWVRPEAADGGVSLVRAMASDLQTIVHHGAVQTLVIASDDDRLIAPIDQAKLAGCTVCLLADDRAASIARLMQEDPTWARLLREADRRLIVPAEELAQAFGGQGGHAVDSSAQHETLQAIVNAWWEDQSSDAKDALRDEVPLMRGLPHEADRELLLQGKNGLGRALSFQEKRMARDLARRIVVGEGDASAPKAPNEDEAS
ncbi:MAG: hypothetical protein ACOVLL_10380 [Hydrogenophaga sp.]|jgi:hypothetical protein